GTGLNTTSGTAGTSIAPLTDSTGQHTFDLTIAAQPFDVLKFDFQLLIAASANCNPVLSAWTVGGSKSRSLATWIQGSAPT
ncbi:hypothetical protein, partial [Pseudoalteromonas distincta]|uniref:hypothetical protein n=1 Tax=Pseudoalteromonas distincta TaxID=77608 RepID=UPI0034E87F02